MQRVLAPQAASDGSTTEEVDMRTCEQVPLFSIGVMNKKLIKKMKYWGSSAGLGRMNRCRWVDVTEEGKGPVDSYRFKALLG
jgi:hypothetical protein